MLVKTVLSTILSVVAGASCAQNLALEIQAIQQHFINARILPDLVPAFNPIALLNVTYKGFTVTPGGLVKAADVQAAPIEITAIAANSSVTLDGKFTLVLADPNAVGNSSPSRTVRHWLVNGVTVGAGGKLVIPPTNQAITAYFGPAPPASDPPHRYTTLLYVQPSTFAPKGDIAKPGQPIAYFNLNDYVTSSGLGPIAAATYFTCRAGSVDNTIKTSAVVSSTLPAYTP